MIEKDFTPKLLRALKERGEPTCAVEIKVARDGRLAYSRLAEHQENALYAVKHGIIPFKIPDVGFQNPFDAIIMTKIPAYIAVIFHERGNTRCYMIDIDKWIEWRAYTKTKSIKEEECRQIGDFIAIL